MRRSSTYIVVLLSALAGRIAVHAKPHPPQGGPVVAVTRADGSCYARSFWASNGTIYLLGPLKSTDGGKRVVLSDKNDPPWGSLLEEKNMNVYFSRKGLFLGVRTKFWCGPDGRCAGKIWRSTDDLKTLKEGDTTLIIPEAGKVDNGKPGEWVGLFFHRRILEMPDGSLLAAMYGNFEPDTIVPTNPRSRSETKYKDRTFVVRSTDEGRTWRYLATVAAPSRDVMDDTEGFNEWSMLRLADGRLLGVMRTGHYTPLTASWSSDGGKTWSRPVDLTELGPGCDPYLLMLSDGRVALAYGQIVPPKEPKELYWKEYDARADHRRRCRLAISTDGAAKQWSVSTVADYGRRTAYPTIFEVEPNLLVYQSDLDLWRVQLSTSVVSTP